MSNYLTPKQKTCPECGRTFETISPRAYRCPECQNRISTERHRAITRKWQMRHSTATHETRECRNCGKPFRTRHNGHLYCSIECYNIAHARRQGAKHVERECRHCGKKFITSRFSQYFCCHDCMARWHRINTRNKKREARRNRPPKPQKPRKPPKQRAARAIRLPPVPKTIKPAWQAQVERDMNIANPDARFAAAQKWTPQMRKYAQKIAMRQIGWRGPCYGL